MTSRPAALAPDHPRRVRLRSPLRLSAARGQLSLELEHPVEVGPLTVTRLVSSLPGLQFPIDLTGGVERFRHRRGSLELLAIEASLSRITDQLGPRIRDLVGFSVARLSLYPIDHGLLVGLNDEDRALAFSLFFAPEQDGVRWVVTDARSHGLEYHAHGAALLTTQALLGKAARRTGSVFTMERAAAHLAQEVLIDAGARVPSTEGLRFVSWDETTDGIRVTAERESVDLITPPHVLRAIEIGRIAESGDEALARGDLEHARDAYLAALERAPRHPGLSLRLAELDLVMQHSPEAALSSVVDAMPALDGGGVAARLLDAVSEHEAASVALRRAAEVEPFPALSAFLFCERVDHLDDVTDKLVALDEAVTRAPGLSRCRWQRAVTRLDAGRVADAVADLGHLEAGCRGAPGRFEACLRAGRLLFEYRFASEAVRFFERALRYLPTSAEASAGLARTFLELGEGERGAALLSRAISLTGRAQTPPPDLLLELAVALADVAQDLPSAIAHARSVPFGTPHAVEARALEGRWRSRLGDMAGASLAYAHARETLQVLPKGAAPDAVRWLEEAADFELRVHQDPRSAMRHAETALKLRPHDSALNDLFRRAAANLAETSARPPVGRREGTFGPSNERSPPTDETTELFLDDLGAGRAISPSRVELDIVADVATPEDEEKVASLTQKVRAEPGNVEVVLELCGLLSQLGRTLELFSLVSAALETPSSPSQKALLEDHRRRALRTLAADAREQGRHDEAELYEQALTDLGDD